MNITLDDSDKIKLLESQNNTYVEQFKTIDIKIQYYENQTKLYNSNKKLNFDKFSQHINDLTKPKGRFDVLLRNFYFYIVTYLEISKMKKDYESVVEENNKLKMENKILKELLRKS